MSDLPERDLRAGIALVAAFASGLTALASALGGAGLGALAALLLNLGLSSRRLYAIGEDLAVGQAALVARVPGRAYRPISRTRRRDGEYALLGYGLAGLFSLAVAPEERDGRHDLRHGGDYSSLGS